jgi:hypothetical protein
MRFDEIDEALRQQPTWQPPSGFAHRVARMVRPARMDSPIRLVDVLTIAMDGLRDVPPNAAATLAGLRWTLRQYWLLISH